MDGFDHILNWRLLAGSHAFPGPDGGTCINEAAIVACGLPYEPVRAVARMPKCFSRPICHLAMCLNDAATDTQRARLLPYVTRLACADTPAVERERSRYIDARISIDQLGWLTPYHLNFERGLAVLEGALAIGRRADPLGVEETATRLNAARGPRRAPGRTVSLPSKVKAWLGLSQAFQDVA